MRKINKRQMRSGHEKQPPVQNKAPQCGDHSSQPLEDSARLDTAERDMSSNAASDVSRCLTRNRGLDEWRFPGAEGRQVRTQKSN